MTPLEIVKKIFAAINRNEMAAIYSFFDPNIVRIEFEGSPSAFFGRGIDEIKPHFEKARTAWAEGGCDPERFSEAGDQVTAWVHVWVRLKDQASWIDGYVIDEFTFRDGKVVEWRSSEPS